MTLENLTERDITMLIYGIQENEEINVYIDEDKAHKWIVEVSPKTIEVALLWRKGLKNTIDNEKFFNYEEYSFKIDKKNTLRKLCAEVREAIEILTKDKFEY